MDGLKIGSAYFEIYAKSEKLKAQMADYTGLVKKTADNFEDAFKNAKLDIDNRVLTMKFSQLEGLHKALVRQLQQKIKMDADVASIEKTRIAIKSVEDALIKTKGATVNYGPVGMSFGRIIQDSAYVTQGFGFWINAVGNNITNFAENVSYARSRGEGFKAMFAGMFTGINGWLIGLNILISLITAVALATRETKEETGSWDLTKLIGELDAFAKSLRKIKEELSALSDDELGSTIGRITKEIADNIYKLQAAANASSISGGGGIFSIIVSLLAGNDPAKATTELSKLTAALKAANDELIKRSSNPNSKNFLEAQLKKLVEDFDAGNTALAPRINKLKAQIKAIEDLINPPNATKKTEFGILQPLEDQVKKLESLKPFATTIQQAADLQEAIKAVKKEIAEMQAGINIANKDISLDGVTAKGVEDITRKNKKGNLYGVEDKKPEETKERVRDIFTEFIGQSELANEAYDTMFSSIMNGFDMIRIKAATNANDTTRFWVNMGNEIMAMMERMIVKWALFNAISLARGGGGFNLFDRLLGEKSVVTTGTNIDSLPSVYAPTYSMNGGNFSDAGIIGELKKMQDRMEALQVAAIKGRSQKVNLFLDGKLIAETMTNQQKDFERGNYLPGR